MGRTFDVVAQKGLFIAGTAFRPDSCSTGSLVSLGYYMKSLKASIIKLVMLLWGIGLALVFAGRVYWFEAICMDEGTEAGFPPPLFPGGGSSDVCYTQMQYFADWGLFWFLWAVLPALIFVYLIRKFTRSAGTA